MRRGLPASRQFGGQHADFFVAVQQQFCQGSGVSWHRLVAARHVGQDLQEFDVRILGSEGEDHRHFVFTAQARDDATGIGTIIHFALANECHKRGQRTPVGGNAERKCHARGLVLKHILAGLQCGQP